MPEVELAPAIKAIIDALAPYLEKLGIYLFAQHEEKKDAELADTKAQLAAVQQQNKDDAAVHGLSGDALADELLNGPR